MSEPNDQRGFQFPGVFEVTALGAADAELPEVLKQILVALGLTIYPDSLRQRPSSKGSYISVSIAFEAHSREDYDAAHGALRNHPAVKWTL